MKTGAWFRFSTRCIGRMVVLFSVPLIVSVSEAEDYPSRPLRITYKPVGLERTGDYFLNNLISYPTDTTIAAARILFSGMLQEMPGLKLCLAHGGGFLPYQIGRFDRGFAAHPACKRAIDKEPHEFLASFFYDTLTHDTGALNYLNATVGSERLLYGSDYPFEMLDESGPQRVRDIDASSDAIDDILGRNAQSLLRSPVPASVKQVESAKA